jgi:hypothetical protein
LWESSTWRELGVLYVIENDLLFLNISESHQIQAMGSAKRYSSDKVELDEWEWNVDRFLAPRSVQFTWEILI